MLKRPMKPLFGMTRMPIAMIKPVGPPTGQAPIAPFVGLATLWVQVTGTWCNLECRHCINASGPKSPWLKPLDAATIARAIREAEEAGVKEIYFTGGEPFLHGEILPLLELALAAAPTTVLTNGTLIGPEMADALAALAARAAYSLELRVSLDDTDQVRNDRIRGEGAWGKAVEAVLAVLGRMLLEAGQRTVDDVEGQRIIVRIGDREHDLGPRVFIDRNRLIHDDREPVDVANHKRNLFSRSRACIVPGYDFERVVPGILQAGSKSNRIPHSRPSRTRNRG